MIYLNALTHNRYLSVGCLLLTFCLMVSVQAQSTYRNEREQALDLLRQSKHTEALPILERIAAKDASDAEVMYYLGFTRLVAAASIKDSAARKQARVRARQAMLRARELGVNNQMLDGMIASVPEDGSDVSRFSKIAAAEEAMSEGEAAFARGELDTARAAYERALKADPQLYEAALYAGDMAFKKGYALPPGAEKNNEMKLAGEWFAKAIAINPDRETAYRYWTSALVDIGKLDEAREKAIEAFIAEPYTRFSAGGLQKVADARGMKNIGHPRIDIPVSVTTKENGNIDLNVAPSAANEQDGSNLWIGYGLTRSVWMTKKFREMYPQEKQYRHTLQEEAEALRDVVKMVNKTTQESKIKKLHPQLATLVKLEQAGLLEPYVLLARPDQGIAQDYAAYRQANKDKLRRYVSEYVMSPQNQ